jgi:putative transposase
MIPAPGCILHTDRGSQVQVKEIRARSAPLRNGRIDGPRRCCDNAAMESFFSLLQKNALDRRRWDTREELRIAIVTWIERRRIPVIVANQ